MYPAMTVERFWKKVNKNGPIVREELGPCWLWPRISEQGYGKTTVLLKHWSAHRLAWFYKHGPIPEDMCICHKCDVRNCVRPAHLFVGTNMDNTKDKVKKKRHPHGLQSALNRATKLNPEKAEEIRALRAQGFKLKDIAKRYDINFSYVSEIVHGKAWNHKACPT